MLAKLGAYRGELLCALPLALLVICGIYGALWWAYAVLLVILALAVLLCNPFCVLDRVLDPRARVLLAVDLVVGLVPVAIPLAPLASLVLWALAAGLWVIALWRRRIWLALYRVRQSPDVDKVLAHQAYDGDWEAGRAWEQYGCRETRALLHQSIEAECNESEMHRTYMPVYLLGYLHGKDAETRRAEKTQGQQANVKALERTVQEQAEQLASLKRELAAAQREAAKAKEQADAEWAKAHNLEMRLEEMQLDPAARDAAILAYVEAGHTYTEAGTKYGLTKAGAVSAAQRARKKREDGNHA